MILTEQLLEDYEQRVAAAGGHFKLLPLAGAVSARPRAAAGHDGKVPPAPSLSESVRRRRQRG
jgi:hypothetical protein